jgi:hypothetical protein
VPCRTLCSRVAAATDVGRVLAPRFCRLCPNPNLWASRALSAARMSRATAWGCALFSCVASVTLPHHGRLLSNWQVRRTCKIVSRSRSMLQQAMAACGHSGEHMVQGSKHVSRLGSSAQTLCEFACTLVLSSVMKLRGHPGATTSMHTLVQPWQTQGFSINTYALSSWSPETLWGAHSQTMSLMPLCSCPSPGTCGRTETSCEDLRKDRDKLREKA